MGREYSALLIFLVLAFGDRYFERGSSVNVTYDNRSLLIDGQRRVLFSGSIHYPRSTPEVWPELIRKSKEGGLDVIETYVFWNYHEPEKGQYYFEGRFDLVRFVKTVQDAGLFVNLRIGPYVCAEWNYGGFPTWLHFIPGIQFRTTNTPFKNEMQRFLVKIVNVMKEEKLFASQGGPIILAQVENEYGQVESAYGVGGAMYVNWAAKVAVALNTTVPWIMCEQENAPDPVINTCNGFYCVDFTPNAASKPKMWTENYSGWFLSYGYAIPFRPVEDLAFSVARFFEKGGTFQNYYMYFGGTNFGRTAGGPLVATSYDYDAPIDEYDMKYMSISAQNGYGAVKRSGFIRSVFSSTKWAHIYNRSSGCAAFLANIDHVSDANVSFNGNAYTLPAWSVSILPDCKNAIFNTAKVVSQKAPGSLLSRHKVSTGYSLASQTWSWYKERVGIWGDNSFVTTGLLEQINTTRDKSDYLWYSTSISVNEELPLEKETGVFLHVESLGHAALVFVNKNLAGIGYGNHDDASFRIHKQILLKQGNNTVDVLSMLVGLQVGTEGEHIGLDKNSQTNSSVWNSGNILPANQSLIWYKTSFSRPNGNGPLALNLSSMGKGQAWVNGQSIGRYWSSYLSPATGCSEDCDYRGPFDSNKSLKDCGQPTQILYHVPRSWVHYGENLLVLHEELGGNPSKITVLTKTGEEICAHVSESDPPPVDFRKPGSHFKLIGPEIRLACEQGWKIASISFASFGTPQGQCGKFRHGICTANGVLPIIQEACVGRESCSVAVCTHKFGDPCPGVLKSLAVEGLCSG